MSTLPVALPAQLPDGASIRLALPRTPLEASFQVAVNSIRVDVSRATPIRPLACQGDISAGLRGPQLRSTILSPNEQRTISRYRCRHCRRRLLRFDPDGHGAAVVDG